jgi:hypothetical protein
MGKAGDVEASDAAKLFEEVKVIFRDLSERLQNQLSDGVGPRIRRKSRLRPDMVFDLLHGRDDFDDPALGWLMIISSFRDEAPWLYELGLEVHKAFRVGDPKRISTAIDRFENATRQLRHSRFGRYFIDSPEMAFLVHELGNVAQRLFIPGLPLPPSRPPRMPKVKVKEEPPK